MSQPQVHNKKLYGTATVGTKGQIVIPAEARAELGIASGDRLYVIGSSEGGYLGLLKEESLDSLMQHLTNQIESFRALKQDNNKE
jgi:AbrB family looped-hinge helix DNA binding protein